jgi:hypothetical protein
LGAIDDGVAASRRNAGPEAFASNVQQMETIMRKTALTIFGALLISGLAVQMATASEHHMKLRRAYNQFNGPVGATPPARYNWDTNGFGFGGRDPSRVGGEDPSLRPSGS